MRVARYWARAHAESRGYARGAWAGSDTSLQDAQAKAKARAEALLAEVLAADDPALHEYEYQRHDLPEPIVQEFRDADGRRIAAITINRYGASVLNTARLAFVDVDLDRPGRGGRPGGGPGRRAGGLLGRPQVGRPQVSRPQARAEPIDRVLAPLRAWAEGHPDRGARVYRTAAGLRYVLTRPAMVPDSLQTAEFMDAMGADPLYARLCQAQRCFRARLSPKPWRMGLFRAPRLSYEKLADAGQEVQAWLRRYEQASADFDVCALIDRIGNDRPADEDAARLIALHDELSGVGTDRPLA